MREGVLGRWAKTKENIKSCHVWVMALLMYQSSLHQIKTENPENNFFLNLSVIWLYLDVKSLYKVPKIRVPSPNWLI